MTDLWDIIEGRVPRTYSAGHNSGLVRALAWGNQDGTAALNALIEKLHEIEDKMNNAHCPHCGQSPIFFREE
jgi:hypothetical protein